jgi:hypothetical protein
MNALASHQRRVDARPPGTAKRTPLDNWAIGHPFFLQVLRWLLQRLFLYTDPSIFLIVGPTGAGKTTMINQGRKEIARDMESFRAEHPWIVPSVCTESTYIPGRGLDWHGLFTGLLESAHEILNEYKLDPDSGEKRGTLRGLEYAVNSMLLHRAPAVAIIDEGSALVEAQSDEALLRSLRYLKNLGNKSKTHIAIFGDYRLAKMVVWDGQLNRRCHLAHLPGYSGDDGKEMFRPIVEKFEKKLQSEGIECDLLGSMDDLYDQSCGCVGLLRKWVLEAYAESQARQKPIDKKMLAYCAPGSKAVDQWRSEIRDGLSVLQNYIGSVRCDPGKGKNE